MTDLPAPLLEARDLHLWRGERHLLRGVSFRLVAGEFLQLMGPNGVGKTSLLRAICGLLPLETGEIFWRGAPTDRTFDDFHRHVAYLAHSNALKGDLTVHENLRYEVALRRSVSNAEIDDQLAGVGLAHCISLPARVLSAGQRRRVGLARLKLSAASLWILDEPTTNLDASGIALTEQMMTEHLQSGGGVVAAAHHGLLERNPATRTLELRP